MKKNIIFACALAIAAGFTSCSGDYEDASSKHVYSTTDDVPINTSAGVWNTAAMEFPTTKLTTAQSINLEDYDVDLFDQFGLTPSEVVDAIKAGTLDFKVLSSSRGIWCNTPYTLDNGWYINSSNKPCAQSDKEQMATVMLNSSTNSIDIALNSGLAAGTSMDINVGIGKRDAEYGTYDKYVRFERTISVTDPTVIMATLDMAEGDYAGYEFFFNNDYDSQFMACLGLSAQGALNGLADGTTAFYITDSNGNITGREYSADSGDGYYGYWLDWNAQNFSWASGASCYVDAELNECALYFGRYPDASAMQNKQLKVNLKMCLKNDESKYIRFIMTLNM